jgi:hypothetical protein
MYEDEIEAFAKNHGYEINLDNPQSFNEKIVYKKLFDRNPLLVLTADKYRARDYIRDKIGAEAEAHFVPLIWVGKNGRDIPFKRLPDKWIAKPNNGSGRYIIKDNGYVINMTQTAVQLSRHEIISICNRWFKNVHGQKWYEWAYSQIDPLIVIEELLKDNGHVPNDWRFFMFGGKCKMVCVTRNEFSTRYNNYYDENWIRFRFKRGIKIDQTVDKPKNYDQMIEFAEKLSQPFDFIRVDFFTVNEFVYFSELTHYVGSGWTPFKPTEWDFVIGKYWKLGDYKRED